MSPAPTRTSVPSRRILAFALRFAVAYGLLVLAWPLVRPAYRQTYCALGNVLFSGGEASTRFQSLGGSGGLDVQLVLTKRGPPPVTARMQNSSRLVGYMPTVSLIALVIASPLPWKRRWRALLLGLLLVHVFVAFRMAIPIQNSFSNPDALQVHHPGPFGSWLLDVAERAFLSAPASAFVVPILLWVLVAFRRQDWELIGRG